MATKTSVIGFPRIGKNRELKFASEKYFKSEISENELKKLQQSFVYTAGKNSLKPELLLSLQMIFLFMTICLIQHSF